jgi:hypothetical protein
MDGVSVCTGPGAAGYAAIGGASLAQVTVSEYGV